jgi:hypothetical protein
VEKNTNGSFRPLDINGVYKKANVVSAFEQSLKPYRPKAGQRNY